MGQRLVTTIEYDGEKILNCYMHWSAYTRPTLATALEFAGKWSKYAHKTGMRKESAILRCCLDAWDGSGVVSNDLPHLAELGFTGFEDGKKIIAIDRNEGLIAVSEKEMKNNDDWAEGVLTIYIHKNGDLSFWTDVYYTRADREEDEEEEDNDRYPVFGGEELDRVVDTLERGDSLKEDDLRELLQACQNIGQAYGFETVSGLRFGIIE